MQNFSSRCIRWWPMAWRRFQPQRLAPLAEGRILLASGGRAGDGALHLGQQGGHNDASAWR
jgi:hypothetical protein